MANDPIDKLRRTAYPNPERKGCPEPAIFDTLTRREISFDDPVWMHIEHCSPCYCQFAGIREALFKQDRQRDLLRAARRLLPVVLLLLVAAGIYRWQRNRQDESRPNIAVSAGEAAVLNFEDGSEIRGAQGSSGNPAKSSVQHLPRDQLSLTVYLPLGSVAGEYELEISRSVGETVWRTRGMATINDGLTSIPVRGDFRGVAAGEYIFRFRRLNETWHEKSILVK